MGSDEIAFDIAEEIEKALDLGYTHIYVNVDDLENSFGFLRVLARKKSEYAIVYEDTFSLEVCYRILEFLEKSKYDIKDFTLKYDS